MVNLRDKGRPRTEIRSRYTRAKGRPVIYLALLLVVLLIMFIVLNPNMHKERSGRSRGPQNVQEQAEVGFTREGELAFLRSDSTEITRIDIEIADDDYQRERGLMFRRQMELQQGMLFIFEEEELRAFWMKNTYLPLDILYLDAGKRIVSIHENTPTLNENSIPSGYPAKYVVEVNAGFCALYDINVGDLIMFNR